MSTSLLAFLTRLEEHVRQTLPAGAEAWRFQRLVNFAGGEGTLQLWEADRLHAQAEVRRTQGGEGSAAFAGSVQGGGTAGERKRFSFRLTNAEEVERQSRQVADLWREVTAEKTPSGEAAA